MGNVRSDDLELFALDKKRYLGKGVLRKLLPDIETALFFAKVYELDAYKLGELLQIVSNSTLVQALTAEGGIHSTDLQDYLVDVLPDDVYHELKFDNEEAPVPEGELLPMLWEDAMVEVAKSIKEVADKLADTLHMLPSKEGAMMFQSMRVLNRNRPTIGDFKAKIHHQSVPDVAVVLDVSGSMSESTIRGIIEDVVALSWKANAHLMIVSDDTFHWEPGAYSVDAVLAKAQYNGTHYESLTPMFDRDWGSVITIADYDSSWGAKQAIAQCTGKIGKVFDISLVSRPTYLGECLGQLADEVQPLLIASPSASLCW